MSGHCDQCGINCQDCALDEARADRDKYRRALHEIEETIGSYRKSWHNANADHRPFLLEGAEIIHEIVRREMGKAGA